jgi:2-octaprenylphenol hydroxylase
MSETATFDVAIVGAGLVGSALAVGAARAGLSVAIVEAREPSPKSDPASGPRHVSDAFDLRVYALSFGSVRFLTSIGVWGRLDSARLGSFRQMHVWDASSQGKIHFGAADVDVPTLGFIVEDGAVQRALEETLLEHSGVSWYRPATLDGLDYEDDYAVATLGELQIRARLIVGADGANSGVRQMLRIPTQRGDYGQRAIVATLATAEPHLETAWQRFLPGGPLALLPLPGEHVSLVWSVGEDEASELLALNDAEFSTAVSHASEFQLGRLSVISKRAAFPLGWLKVERYIGRQCALVGDAAHAIHPLAGQGVNLGLMDAACLLELIEQAHASGRDIGSKRVLRGYERWRKAHNVYVQEAMAGLLWLFGRSHSGWRGARGLGLTLMHRLGAVKSELSALAMGLRGDLPRSYATARPDLGEGYQEQNLKNPD